MRIIASTITYGAIIPVTTVVNWCKSINYKIRGFKPLSEAKLKTMLDDKMVQLHDDEKPYFQHENYQPIAIPKLRSWLNSHPDTAQSLEAYLEALETLKRRHDRRDRDRKRLDNLSQDDDHDDDNCQAETHQLPSQETHHPVRLSIPVVADTKIYLCLLDSDIFGDTEGVSDTIDNNTSDNNGTSHDDRIAFLAEYISVWFQRQVVVLKSDQLSDFDIKAIATVNTKAGIKVSSSDIHKYLINKRCSLPDCAMILALTKHSLFRRWSSPFIGAANPSFPVAVMTTYSLTLSNLRTVTLNARVAISKSPNQSDSVQTDFGQSDDSKHNHELGKLLRMSLQDPTTENLSLVSRELANNKQFLTKCQMELVCEVAAHELCHTIRIGHCVYYTCVMNSGNHDRQTINSGFSDLCPVDLYKLKYAMNIDNVADRQRQLQVLQARLGFVKF